MDVTKWFRPYYPGMSTPKLCYVIAGQGRNMCKHRNCRNCVFSNTYADNPDKYQGTLIKLFAITE